MLFRKQKLIFISITLLMMLVNALNCAILRKTLFAEEQKFGNLSEAVLSVLHKSLPAMVENRLPFFNVFAYSAVPGHLQYFEDTMQKILNGLTRDISVRVGLSRSIYADRARHDAVILVDTAEALNFIYKDLERLHLKANHFYIIVLHTFRPYFYDELLEILTKSWQIGVLHVIVLVHALWNSILLYNSFPYDAHQCAGISPALQNRFENYEWQHKGKNFFPLKVGHLHGCKLVCATWEDMPYLKITPTELIGIEGRLLNYMEENLNFKIKIQYMTEKQIQRTVTDEYGLFDELFSTGIDFVLGAFPYKPTALDSPYAPTTTYHLSDLYIFINGKREPFSHFTKLILPFFYEIWALLFFIFLLGALISTIAAKHNNSTRSFIIGSSNNTPIYNMFIVGLGGNISRPPKRNFARFLLFMWLLATLVIRGAYQAFMFHYIRTDIVQVLPNTIQAILEQNYRILMSESVFNAIEKLPEIRSAAHVFNGSEFEYFHKLNEAFEKIAILAPYEYYAYYKQLQAKPPSVHVVREKIFTQQLSMYMRKNSVMLRRFNIQIANYIQYGIGQKLLRENMGDKFEKNLEESNSLTLQRVGIDEILGTLQLLLIGYAISSFVLVLEMLIFKIARHLKRKKKAAA